MLNVQEEIAALVCSVDGGNLELGGLGSRSSASSRWSQRVNEFGRADAFFFLVRKTHSVRFVTAICEQENQYEYEYECVPEHRNSSASHNTEQSSPQSKQLIIRPTI